VLVTTQARWWRRRSSGELPVQDLPEMATVDAFAAVDDRDVLIRLLSTLNGRQRAVLALHFYDGLSEEEVATVLGCAIGTVKSAGARALDRLERSGLLSEEVEAGGKES
jgi:RNA polymerase sigma factor (sigma-70 family)